MTGGRRRRRIRTAAWLAAALVLTGLTACNNDDPPPQTSATTTPTTPTTGSTPSPTITPPTAPKAAPTQKSAEAFVRYFWAVYNYSYKASNVDLIQSLSEQGCQFCSGVVNDITESKANHATTEGGVVDVLVATAPPGEIHGFIVVSSVLRQQASRVIGGDQRILSTSPALDSLNSAARLNWHPGGWRVAALTLDRKK